MDNEYINSDGRAFDGRVWPLWVASLFPMIVGIVILYNLFMTYGLPFIARLV